MTPWWLFVAVSLLGCSDQGATRDEAKGTYTGPPIGAIRWDAWSNDSSLSWWTSSGNSKAIPSGTKWHYRQPSLWNSFQLWGSGVDTQAIVDAEIAAAKGKLDYWAYDWYPPAAILAGTGDETDTSGSMNAFEAHWASAHKADVKFCFILQYAWIMHASGAYKQAFFDWIAARVADSSYMRIGGKPFVILYNDGLNGGWTNNVADWDQLKTTIGEAVFGAAISSVGLAQACSLQCVVTYGPNGTLVAPFATNGRHAYADLHQVDLSHDAAAAGLSRASSRTAMMDRRPKTTPESSTPWSDQPTQPEWVAAMQDGTASGQKTLLISAWDEVTENGPGIVPTTQEGSRYLDAIDWVRNNNWPSTYSFAWSANWKSCGTSGTWTEYFPDPNGVQGAHDGDQIISSAAGDYRSITMNEFLACDVYAETGPDCGILEIYKDGVLDQTIDCYAAGQSVSVKVATVTFSGIPNTHTIRAQVKGTKNASSSSVQIKLDYFKPTYIP